MKNWLIILFVCTTLISCAVTPPPPTPIYNIKPGAKIGVYVDIADKPFHSHIGTTIFNNFKKELNFDWNIPAIAETNLTQKLKESGFEVVTLERANFKSEELAFLIQGKDKQWVVNDKYENIYNKLKQDLGLDAVVVVREIPVTVISQCGAYGCTYFGSERYGLFTRSFLGLDSYNAVYNFSLNVLLLDQLMNFGWGAHVPGNDILFKEVDMEDPQIFDDITEEELSKIKDAVTHAAKRLHFPVLRILKVN